MVREALELAAAGGQLPWAETEAVGGWWNRQFDPEIDLVGAGRSPVASQVTFAGSIKWLGSAFDAHDLAALQRGAAQIPGHDPTATGVAVVSLAGTALGLDLRA